MEEWTEDDLSAQTWAEREQRRRSLERRLAAIEARLAALECPERNVKRAAAPVTETAARFAPVA
ncbi:MAG: hypothetical protein GX620_03245 [Chloroflexi bacterium]|nr:hypothetical protein [Chloroflexota bacterium]